MPFILQDGRLVQVSDAEYEAFTGVPQATRVTTAADRRARREAEAAAAGGQNIQVTDPAAPSNNQQIINPNTTNNTPGQTLDPVPASLQSSTATNITEAPPIPGLERPRGFQTDSVSFTREELNAAGITNILPDTPLRASSTEPDAVDSNAVPGLADNFDPNAGFPPLTPAFTESEVVPGFTADPRAAGENFGVPASEIETEPEPVDSPYVDEDPDTLVDFNTGERVTAGQAQADAAIAQAAVNNARNQQSIREQRRNNPSSADWRVRIRLAPNATYLYNAADAGILEPLSSTSGSDGVIFPYTPSIQTVYKANYNSYDLTHSNYRGFFYQSSMVEDIQITGTFTAQDSVEAEYLLAVIHFFRSATKMFYGQDTTFRGAPPPLVYLSAFGQYQYVDAPCVISSFNYNLPADVDYVRARSPNQDGTNLLKRRDRGYLPTNSFSAALQRLKNARTGGLPLGGETKKPPPPTLGLNSPTYVPTRMEITVILHPMQSRQQVSQQFSLKDYSSGRLQPKGFW